LAGFDIWLGNAFYDIRLGNGVGLFLQCRSLHGANSHSRLAGLYPPKVPHGRTVEDCCSEISTGRMILLLSNHQCQGNERTKKQIKQEKII